MTQTNEEDTPQNGAILLLTSAGPLQKSLQLLLASISGVRQVLTSQNTATALETISHLRPQLVLLDHELLGSETSVILGQIKATSPVSRRVVLVNDIRQVDELSRPAAEAILLKGVLPTELVASIEQLLSMPGENQV